MTTTKTITPGKWEGNEHFVYDEFGQSITWLYDGNPCFRANLAAILQVPEMVEILRVLVKFGNSDAWRAIEALYVLDEFNPDVIDLGQAMIDAEAILDKIERRAPTGSTESTK